MSLSINPAALSENSPLQMTNQNNIKPHKKGFYEAGDGNMVLTATAHMTLFHFCQEPPSPS